MRKVRAVRGAANRRIVMGLGLGLGLCACGVEVSPSAGRLVWPGGRRAGGRTSVLGGSGAELVRTVLDTVSGLRGVRGVDLLVGSRGLAVEELLVSIVLPLSCLSSLLSSAVLNNRSLQPSPPVSDAIWKSSFHWSGVTALRPRRKPARERVAESRGPRRNDDGGGPR